MLTRRQFLKMSALAGASLYLPWRWSVPPPFAADTLVPSTLTKFIDPLPIPGVMPQLTPNYYELTM